MMSNAQVTQYQALLLDQSCIQFHMMMTSALNPAGLPDNNPADTLHDCLEVTNQIQFIRSDLTDTLLATPAEVFTDSRAVSSKMGLGMQEQ